MFMAICDIEKRNYVFSLLRSHQQLWMETGEPGADGPRVQGAVEVDRREEAGRAPILPPGMEAVLAQVPVLKQKDVTFHHVWPWVSKPDIF